ncbi:MAG: lysine--tRNA ligase [Acidobacteria bacterium]|nr:MAG: lysine--tRNA ligase [Acidobacteriota bacterium]
MTSEGTGSGPGAFRPSARASELISRFEDLPEGEGSGVGESVAGRVVARRDSGKLVFVVLQDSTGRIQLFCSLSELDPDSFATAKDCDLGDWLGAQGEIIRTKRGELSVKARSVTLVAKAMRPLPDKWHGVTDTETRYRQRYLDLIVNPDARQALEAKAKVLASVRSTLADRGFIEVETPILQPLPGGAAAKPFSARYEALDTEVYMRVAPELYLKRVLVGGVERIYELGRCFRNEGISTRHNPEFTMLEAYQAFADYSDMMELVEAIVAAAALAVMGTTQLIYAERELDLTPPWDRRSLAELASDAVGRELSIEMSRDELANVAASHGLEVQADWGPGKILFHIYDKLAEGEIWGPAFVVDFPEEVSPLARPHADKAGLAERFEAVCAGREMANAFSELNDPVLQRERLEAQAKKRAAGDEEAMRLDEDFLRALEHGMPPAGGMGLGIDRLVMLLTNASSIREALTFPQLRPEKGL